MDTEQRYLRDIRDAIKGVEKRSSMQSNGNEKAKYLKDIADAIRENGGGTHDGNDKVKQTPANDDDTELALLLGYSSPTSTETNFVKKISGLLYDVANKIFKLKGRRWSGTTLINEETDVYQNKVSVNNTSESHGGGGTNINKSAGKLSSQILVFEYSHKYTSSTTHQTTEDVNKTLKIDGFNSDFILSGFDGDGEVTWDGTNTSLKAALAAAKNTSLIVTFTPSSGSSGQFDPFDCDTSLSDISDAILDGKNVIGVIDWNNGTNAFELLKPTQYYVGSNLVHTIKFEGEKSIDFDETNNLLIFHMTSLTVSMDGEGADEIINDTARLTISVNGGEWYPSTT